MLLGGGDDDGVLPRNRRGGVGELPREDGEEERNAKRSRRARRAAATEAAVLGHVAKRGMRGIGAGVLYGFALDNTQSESIGEPV